MSVLALITDEKAIKLVLPWASSFAESFEADLRVVCWTHSAVPSNEIEDPGSVSEDLVKAVRTFCSDTMPDRGLEVIGVGGPSESRAAIAVARESETQLIVAAASDPVGARGASYATNPLLKQSPFTTVILFGDATRSTRPGRFLVGASDNVHDEASLFLADRLARKTGAQLVLARTEFESGQAGQEVGRRELEQLMRNAGVEQTQRSDLQVFQAGDYEVIAEVLNKQDLFFVGANYEHLPEMLEISERPTIAVVKRAPPLRTWQRTMQVSAWNTRLSPADYADLIQGLRRGSKLSADFLTMLSLAAVVASLGLLQDSAAVVIGSMLLAPLMTPMIGCGLALAQANPKLGNNALRTVAVGLLCTLAISFLIGFITPGIELTPQIYARGAPTVLDLLVAVASAAAASYALARPNLVGSIAGVAIATALVPPLCSVGISLAYLNITNAQGAALLFVTNFFAIVLASSVTFYLIGITSSQAGKRQKLWVFRLATLLGIGIILVSIPLQTGMQKSLVESKPQPRVYPLAKNVMDALEVRLEAHPEFRLISAGEPSSHFAESDVVLVLGTTGQADPAFVDELIALLRDKMRNDSLVVDVHSLRELSHKRAN